MTVEEIKAKLPEAEVYELKPDAKYLIVVCRPLVSEESRLRLSSWLASQGIKHGMLSVLDSQSAVRILEMKE